MIFLEKVIFYFFNLFKAPKRGKNVKKWDIWYEKLEFIKSGIHEKFR